MAQSLFDDLRSRNIEPFSPPKLKPNFLARVVRFCWRRAWWVVAVWVVIAAAASGLAFRNATAPQGQLLPVPVSTRAMDEAAANFVRLDMLQTITLSNPDPQLLDDQRADLLQTMRQRGDIYELVFAPGTGDYYESHGLLYHPLDEIKGRVAYALSLRPLFTAVGDAPNAGSFAILVNEVAAAIKQGRDPQGVDDLLSESAASIQALMQGEDKPVDWARIADLDSDNTSTTVTVLALPRRGQAAAAGATTEKLLNVLRSASDTQASVFKTDGPSLQVVTTPVEWPRAAAGAMIGLVFASLILALALGRLRLIAVIFVPVAVVAAIIAACVIGLAGADWLSFWPMALGLVVIATALSVHFALCAVNQAAGMEATETNLMLAAQERGTECLWIAGLMFGPWAGLLALRTESTSQLTLFVLALVLLSLATVFTLGTALFRLAPEAAKWRAGEWLIPAHRALFETGQWQFLARSLGAALVLAALGLIFFAPVEDGSIKLDAPVTLLAKTQVEAEMTIARLKSFPAAEGVRWLAMFLPQAAQDKRDALQGLKDQFPRITPVASAGEQDLRDEIDTLQQSLKDIAEAASTKPKLKQAADEFRRSLALLAATSGDAQIRQLENRLFGGFNRLADRADLLTSIETPSLETLPPELVTLFGSPDNALRIEVIPATGTSNASLALTLEQAGFNVVHPAVVQRAEADAKLKAILLALGSGIAFGFVLLVLAFAGLTPLVGAGLMLFASLVVLVAAERLLQNSWNLPWLLGTFTVLSSLMAALYLTPTSRGSTALSAVELFLVPAMGLAVMLPLQLLNTGPIAAALVPMAVGLALVATVIGLLQQHRPQGEQNFAADEWANFEG